MSRIVNSVLGLVACSLTGCAGRLASEPPAPEAGATEAAAPDAGLIGCAAKQELCDGVCVTDDVMHCGPSCAPCAASAPFEHPTCDGAACGVACDVLECGGVCTGPDDASNCGACGRSCGGQPCTQSLCVPEVVETGSEISFAVGGGSVYFSALLFNSSSELRVVPTTGGTPVAVAGGAGAYDVALDASRVYWTSLSTLWSDPLGGGTPTDLASQVLGGPWIADPTAYYGGAAEVWQVPTAGGTPALFANTIHYAGLAVDATDVYVAGEGLVRLARSDGAATTLRPTTESEEAIALDAQNIYYARYGTTSYTIEVMPKSSPTTPATVASVQDAAGGLAVDGSYLYVGSGTSLLRFPKTGGPSLTLATTQLPIRQIAVDSGYVYFADGARILRTPE